MSNAVKYTPNNGNILIKTHLDNGYAEITVKDNGIGIAPENQERIFEKFEQIHNVKTMLSTGLGLAITKELVKMHDGTITVNSEKDKGAEFIVRLPLL